MNVDLDVVVITISPQKLEVSGIYLETVVLTIVPNEFFPGTLVVYLGDYTGVSVLGDAYGDPGVLLTVKFPTIATPLNGRVRLSPLVITITPIDIQPYQPRSTCELTGMLDRMRLDGWPGDISGDMTCELSTLLNNIRTDQVHTPVGDSNCSLSELTELVLTEYNAPPISSIEPIWGDISSLSFSDNDGQFYVKVGDFGLRLLTISITYHLKPGGSLIYSVKYNGVALTLLRKVMGYNMAQEVWYLINPEVGTNIVEILMFNNTSWVSARAFTIVGVDQTAPFYKSTYTMTYGFAPGLGTSLTLGVPTGHFAFDFVCCSDAACTLSSDDVNQATFISGLMGDVLTYMSHRNGQEGNLIFQWEKTLAASYFTQIGMIVRPANMSSVSLEVSAPTDDCELAWSIYDVINSIRGTIH